MKDNDDDDDDDNDDNDDDNEEYFVTNDIDVENAIYDNVDEVHNDDDNDDDDYNIYVDNEDDDDDDNDDDIWLKLIKAMVMFTMRFRIIIITDEDICIYDADDCNKTCKIVNNGLKYNLYE